MNAKVFIVLLVLVALAFIGFELLGSHNHSVGASSSGGGVASASSFDPGSYPVMQSMNNVLAPFSPKLKLPQTQYVLTAQQPTASIGVPADSSDSLRQAKFALSSADCAVLKYAAIGGSEKLKSQCGPQTSPLCPSLGDSHASPDPLSASFVVTEGGGTILLARRMNGPQACVVTLKD